VEIFGVDVRDNLIHRHTYLTVPLGINCGITFVDVILVTVPGQLYIVGEIHINEITGILTSFIIDSVFPSKAFKVICHLIKENGLTFINQLL
jgi:hypothetical protein